MVSNYIIKRSRTIYIFFKSYTFIFIKFQKNQLTYYKISQIFLLSKTKKTILKLYKFVLFVERKKIAKKIGPRN